MLSYCLKCRKKTESKNQVTRPKSRTIMLLSKYAVCASKNQNVSNRKELVDY